jgi:phosphoglucomutase
MALYLLSQGKTIMDRLRELYELFGYYEELQVSRYFQGASGRELMDGMMGRLRDAPPAVIAGVPVVTLKDYQVGTTRDVASGSTTRDIHLPSSNVLQFILSDGTVVSARPSGTEPKIKFYASVPSPPEIPIAEAMGNAESRIGMIEGWIDQQIEGATG